jgi:hypothetical protein
MERKCNQCETFKPNSEYYAGHGVCKECYKKRCKDKRREQWQRDVFGPMPTEAQEQEVLVMWLQLHGILHHHSPNEGKHAVQYRVKQQRLGVSKGFPDLLIFDSPKMDCYHGPCMGIAIELKRRKGGRTSAEQKAWLNDLEQRGWLARVCNGADEAIAWLRELGFGRGAA